MKLVYKAFFFDIIYLPTYGTECFHSDMAFSTFPELISQAILVLDGHSELPNSKFQDQNLDQNLELFISENSQFFACYLCSYKL